MSKMLDDIIAAKKVLESFPKPRDEVYCVAPQVERQIKRMIPEKQGLTLPISAIKIRTLPALRDENMVHCIAADHKCLKWSDYNLAMFLNALLMTDEESN